MWYKVHGWNILASADALPASLQNATPAMIQKEGWRWGIQTPRPYTTSLQDAQITPSYDPKTDTVTEVWQIVSLDPDIIANYYRKRRAVKLLAKTDPVAAILKGADLL